MSPKEFSLTYVNTILECLNFQNSEDLHNKNSNSFHIDWSSQIECKLRRKLQDLFYYETQDVVTHIKNDKDVSSNSKGYEIIKAIHFGAITEDFNNVISKGLMLADKIVFQDLLYRNLIFGMSGSLSERLGSIPSIAIQLQKIKYFIEKDKVYFVPWLPKWDKSFYEKLSEGNGFLDLKSPVDSTIAVGFTLSFVLDGVPFTTWDSSLNRTNETLASYRKSSLYNSNINEAKYLDVQDYLLKDDKFKFLNNASPEDILKLSGKYSDFKDKIRAYFKDALIIDDQKIYNQKMVELMKDLHMELETAKAKIKMEAIKTIVGAVATGMACVVAAVDIPTTEFLKFGLGAGTGLAATKVLEPFVKWIESKIGTVKSGKPTLAESLIQLERASKREKSLRKNEASFMNPNI